MTTEDQAPDDDRRELRRLVRLCFALFVFACLATLFSVVLRNYFLHRLYDDAFIFQRYATRLMTEGRLAWNPGGEPTYGLTSPLFLLVVAPLQRLAGGNTGLAALGASSLAGVVFLGLSYKLVATVDSRATVRGGTVALAAFCMALTQMPDHFFSGMETTFALSYVAGYLISVRRMQLRRDRASALLVGVLGGMAFGVRPELLSYTLLMPALIAVLASDAPTRRLARIALLATVALLGLHLFVNALYFDSALPLSFYVKSTRHYAPKVYEVYRGVAAERLLEFILGYWPLMVLAIHQLASVRRSPRSTASLVDVAVFCATLAIAGYHLLFALPVMSYSQRFLYPTLPGLIYLSARAIAGLASASEGAFAKVDPRLRAIVACGAMGILLLSVVPRGVSNALKVVRQWAKKQYVFDVEGFASTKQARQWGGLVAVSKLPDDLVMATTEVGLPGVMNPRKVLVDLAGLNERMFAHERFSAERLFATYKPDLIYMPHSDYADINKALRASPMMKGYRLHEAQHLKKGSIPMAVRRDSRHYAELERIVSGLRRRK